MKLAASLLILALASCGTPTPQPSPSPSPTVAPSPTPVPTPTPDLCVVPPNDPPGTPAEALRWHPLDPSVPSQLADLLAGVRAQKDVWGPPHPDAPDVLLEALAEHLREMGVCAEVHDDAVFVREPDATAGLWVEVHAYSYATGDWASKPWVIRLWRYM